MAITTAGDIVRAALGKLLAENQEFTALNREQTKRLVENTLATRACFNQQLCNDTATLFWRTNLKVNRDTIIKEWRATARKASHPTLLENVSILERSANFEAAYDKFINLVFNEAVGPRDVQIHAYRTALKALKDTPKIKESNELSGKIDELIERLEQPESDHAVIAEVEDLLAEVKNEMNALESLDDFDKIPGGADDEESLDDLGGDTDSVDLGGMGGKSGTTVNFNINISGDGVSTGGLEGGAPDDDADLDDLLGDKETEEEPDEESGGDEDIEKLLGGSDEEEEEEGGDEGERHHGLLDPGVQLVVLGVDDLRHQRAVRREGAHRGDHHAEVADSLALAQPPDHGAQGLSADDVRRELLGRRRDMG
jgi:hypothetical protein